MYKFFKKPVNQKLGPLRSNLYTLHAASIVDHSQTYICIYITIFKTPKFKKC